MSRKNNGSKLFLMELLLCVFFFAVILAVCVYVFAQSYTLSKSSEDLTYAVNESENVAEYFYTWDGSEDSWCNALGGSWYDGAWEKTDGDICVLAQLEAANGLQQVSITVYYATEEADIDLDAQTIYELSAERIE